MMSVLTINPYRGAGFGVPLLPRSYPTGVEMLLAECPKHAETPLIDQAELAARCGVAKVFVKDESQRMGLGSFKALGAAFAIAYEASLAMTGDWSTSLNGRTFATASAGNHGLSVAVGAAIFGAQAVVFIADTVPESFADRLRAKGAKVIREGATYEDSMNAALDASNANGWTLLSDSSWDGYTHQALRVMEGYLHLAAEIVWHIPEPPTHILLQAGVGGMAAALAAHFRLVWGNEPKIIVVEPEVAPALHNSIIAGRLVATKGPVSNMGRLDCKTPSLVALAGLARDADAFTLVSETDAEKAVAVLNEMGLPTSPSGGAGLAALISGLDLGADARVLAVLSEGPEVEAGDE